VGRITPAATSSFMIPARLAGSNPMVTSWRDYRGLDRRLQGRVDPSEVIQEAYLEAARRLPEYLKIPVHTPRRHQLLRFTGTSFMIVAM